MGFVLSHFLFGFFLAHATDNGSKDVELFLLVDNLLVCLIDFVDASLALRFVKLNLDTSELCAWKSAELGGKLVGELVRTVQNEHNLICEFDGGILEASCFLFVAID